MRNFIVNVNGVSYKIEDEEVSAEEAAVVKTVPTAPVAPTAPTAPTAPVAPTAPANGQKVESPMPGTILDVRVKVGDSVKQGDVVMILEAMQMANEILAPCDGTIADVRVQKSSTVDSGALLVVIA